MGSKDDPHRFSFSFQDDSLLEDLPAFIRKPPPSPKQKPKPAKVPPPKNPEIVIDLIDDDDSPPGSGSVTPPNVRPSKGLVKSPLISRSPGKSKRDETIELIEIDDDGGDHNSNSSGSTGLSQSFRDFSLCTSPKAPDQNRSPKKKSRTTPETPNSFILPVASTPAVRSRRSLPFTDNLQNNNKPTTTRPSTKEIIFDYSMASPANSPPPVASETENQIEIIEEIGFQATVTSAQVPTTTTKDLSDDDDDLDLPPSGFAAIKARFDAITRKSLESKATTSTSTTTNQITASQEQRIVTELEQCSMSQSDFTILREPKSSKPAPEPKGDDHDWIELDDDDDELGAIPKSLGIGKSKLGANKGTLVRSKKKVLSGKKMTKLKGTTLKPRKIRINKNLFSDPSDSEPEPAPISPQIPPPSTSSKSAPLPPPQPLANQLDAIKHVTARMSSTIYELIRGDLPKARLSGKDFAISSFEDEFDCLPSVKWKVSEVLGGWLKEAALDPSMGGLVRVRRGDFLDQLVLLIKAPLLHDCVAKFIEYGGATPNPTYACDPESPDLFGLVQSAIGKHDISNVTLVIYGLDAYLRNQRLKANANFRRQMNALMAGKEPDQAAKKSRSKKKPEEESPPTVELSLEHIELCLIDTRMRLLFDEKNGGGGDDRRGEFSVKYAESGEELVNILFHFARAVSEQIFRFRRTRASCIDFYAAYNPMTSIDPTSRENRRDLWERQLQQFPGISAQTARVLVARFPTPRLLHQAIVGSRDPVDMLSRITGTARGKLGYELAYKIVTFMSSDNPDLFLKSKRSQK